MKTRNLILVLTLLAALWLPEAAPTQAQDIPATEAVTALLLRHYNAINLKDYATAYRNYAKPAQSYQQFVAGYADTARIEVYFGDFLYRARPQVGGELGRIPAVLFGFRVNGAIVTYHGCFGMGWNQAAGWQIDNTYFRLLSNSYLPDAQTILRYTDITQVDCFSDPFATRLTPSFGASGLDNGQMTLTYYYSLINARNYADAYAAWLKPLPGPKPNNAPAQDYRPPFNSFVAGYRDTVYVNTFYGPYQEMGASAGRSYLNGLLPTVLIGQQTNGTIKAYYGCYVLGWLAPNRLGIVSGKFVPLTNGAVPTARQIFQALAVNCLGLHLQL